MFSFVVLSTLIYIYYYYYYYYYYYSTYQGYSN